MAYHFVMAAEFADIDTAEQFASKWDLYKHVVLKSGKIINHHVSVVTPDDSIWVEAFPLDDTKSFSRFPNGGPSSVEDANEMNELTAHYYKLLTYLNSFRFAAAGIEVTGFNTYGAISEPGFWHKGMQNIIVSNDIWLKLNKPDFFEKFSSTHMWLPNREYCCDE